MHTACDVICEKKRAKKMFLELTFDLIGSLPTNHIIAHITMALKFVRKRSLLTVK